MKIKQKNVNFIEKYNSHTEHLQNTFTFSYRSQRRKEKRKEKYEESTHLIFIQRSFMSVFTIFHTYMYDVLQEYAYSRI